MSRLAVGAGLKPALCRGGPGCRFRSSRATSRRPNPDKADHDGHSFAKRVHATARVASTRGSRRHSAEVCRECCRQEHLRATPHQPVEGLPLPRSCVRCGRKSAAANPATAQRRAPSSKTQWRPRRADRPLAAHGGWPVARARRPAGAARAGAWRAGARRPRHGAVVTRAEGFGCNRKAGEGRAGAGRRQGRGGRC